MEGALCVADTYPVHEHKNARHELDQLDLFVACGKDVLPPGHDPADAHVRHKEATQSLWETSVNRLPIAYRAAFAIRTSFMRRRRRINLTTLSCDTTDTPTT